MRSEFHQNINGLVKKGLHRFKKQHIKIASFPLLAGFLLNSGNKETEKKQKSNLQIY